MLSIRTLLASSFAVCAMFQAGAAENPWDIEFKRVWQGRNIFDAELPFPKDVNFLPVAHYSAEVTALPFEMRVVDEKGKTIVSFPAPKDVAVPYTMHLGFGGRTRVAVFATKGGALGRRRTGRRSFRDPRS